MDALPISLEARPFQGLINGLIKKNFNGERDFTNEYLLGELYANKEEQEEGQFASEIALYEKILVKAAQLNWDQEQLVEFLGQRSLPEGHVQVFANTWSKEASRINKQLLKNVTWNNTYERVAWRVDVRALSKTTAEQSDEPIAFFEVSTSTSAGGNKVAKFEMDRSEVQGVLNTFNEIQAVFDAARLSCAVLPLHKSFQ